MKTKMMEMMISLDYLPLPHHLCRTDQQIIERGIMKDILGIMKQAKEMQAKMAEMQDGLADVEAMGSSGAGMVTVTLSGKGDLKSLTIDPSMISDGEGEMIEDLIIAAHADAKSKVEEIMAEKTKELTAGLPIPPGMKLPF